MRWVRRYRIRRLRERVRDLNFLLNSINPRSWPDEYASLWNDRVLVLRILSKLEAKEAPHVRT